MATETLVGTPTVVVLEHSDESDVENASPSVHPNETPFRDDDPLNDPANATMTGAPSLSTTASQTNEQRVGPTAGVQCRLLPHGGYAVIPALLSTFAWLAVLSQDGCDYARLTGPVVLEITGDPGVPFLDVGFNQYRAPTMSAADGDWNVDYQVPCEDYEGKFATAVGYWSFAKGTGFLSLVFGGGGALFLWFSSCFVFSRGTWKWAGYELLAATVFQLFTFSWFKTGICHGNGGQDSCALFYGSKIDILASCFWFMSVVTIFGQYPKATPKGPGRRTRGTGQSLPSEVEMAEQPPMELELPMEGRPDAGFSGSTNDGESPSINVDNEHQII